MRKITQRLHKRVSKLGKVFMAGKAAKAPRKVPEFLHKRQITGIGTGRINRSWSKAWDQGLL